jgi:hypothetical protein
MARARTLTPVSSPFRRDDDWGQFRSSLARWRARLCKSHHLAASEQTTQIDIGPRSSGFVAGFKSDAGVDVRDVCAGPG